MGTATITESGIWEAPAAGLYSLTLVPAGSPGTNGFDNGVSGGLGMAGLAGVPVTLSANLAGAYVVQIGQPCPLGAGETKGGYAGQDATHFGFLASAPGPAMGTVRDIAAGGTNATGYGSGGPSGDPGDPVDTVGQSGGVVISWDD